MKYIIHAQNMYTDLEPVRVELKVQQVHQRKRSKGVICSTQ